MRARVQFIRKNKIKWDQVLKNRKNFIQNNIGRGFLADKVRLDIDLESIADVVALGDWCNMVYLCFKK